MIRKELAQLEYHIQELNRMSGVLFELWGDKVSHIFGEKCIGVIKNDWKNYRNVPHPNARLSSTFLKANGFSKKVDYLTNEILK